MPKLLVVDLKLPLMDGFELLAWLQDRPQFGSLPVIVISSSNLDSDREKAFQLGAKDYLVKPHNPDELVPMIRSLPARWMAEGARPELAPEALQRLRRAYLVRLSLGEAANPVTASGAQ